jgi:signal transduction histidine kinase/ActR/RegA family two-component response regulator
MKVRSRLSLILFTGITIVILLSMLLNFFITRENKKLLQESLTETKQVEVPKAFALHGSNIKNFAFDYSIWDQLVKFMYSEKDTAWLNEEVIFPLSLQNIDHVWIIDSSAKEYFYTSIDSNKKGIALDIRPDVLKQQLSGDFFKHFFLKKDKEIIEVYTGPVHPNSDPDRKSRPNGYLLLGRKVDNEYINTLHDIEREIIFSLNDTGSQQETILASSGSIEFSVPLNDITGSPIAYFNVAKNYPVLVSNRKYLFSYLLCFIVLIIVLGFVFFFVSKKLLFRPLYSITTALESKDPVKIAGLSKSKTEYGELSRLVIDFFEQNNLLAKEIASRKEAEVALFQSLEEKEQAITAKIKAEQTTLAKSDFLSTMSHEIRTPINGVIGLSNLLLEEKLSDKQMEYVKTLNFSAQHLLALVSDILDFSKIESGSLHLEKTSFNLEKLCKHVFDLYKGKADEKGIVYNFNPVPVKDYSLYGDPTRLSQILSNLLSNAIKFTSKGSVDFSYTLKDKEEPLVELSYRLKEESNHKVLVEFIIKDSGIGIPQQQQSKIFESFSQADKSITREYGGSGLGLTISKRLVELHGGSITVNSVHGKGSEFIVSVPLDKHVYTDKEALERNARKTPTEKLTGMKILIAEDNHINALVLTRFLQKWNAEFVVAKDGQEAVDCIKKERFDVVLMDLQMPIMDGMEATALIRNIDDDSINKIPIVAFTADALIDNHRRLIKLGFDHCLTKPFNPEALLKFLKRYHNTAA